MELQDLCKTFRGPQGEAVQAVRHLDLRVDDGELLVLVGPSGCGKTSTLRLIAGLEEVTAGSVLIGDRRVNEVPPRERDVAMVFQSYALFPHLTVGENLALGLRLRGVAKAERAERVRSVADLLGLGGLLERKPAALSGGERQRVALGRALVRQPGVLLLDEPFSSLDAVRRVAMRMELAGLQRRLGATVVYVTHDQVEALTLGERVAVMHQGALQQVAQPLELYRRPATLFVAGFIGSPPMNLFRGILVRAGGRLCFREQPERGEVSASSWEVSVPPAAADRLEAGGAGEVILGVRAEHVRLDRPQSARGGKEGFRARLELVEILGWEVCLHLRAGATRFVAKQPGPGEWEANEVVAVSLEMGEARFFDPGSQRLLV